MNRLEMTRAAVDVAASGTETDPTFVIPTRGNARGICCGAAKADFSPMNRLEMTRAELDVVASGTETDPTFVIPTRGNARGICCGGAKSGFLADEWARNDKGGCG